MFDLSFIDKDAILNELKLLNSEILLETHSERKLIKNTHVFRPTLSQQSMSEVRKNL